VNAKAARKRGRFVTLEGGEGAGKSTQIRLLADALKGAGVDVLVTREPGGAPAAEIIRGLLVEGAVDRWQPMTEVLLHTAARFEHVTGVIKPALAAGRWVLSDRFADSTVAYQGYGHDLGADVVLRLHELVFGNFQPDLTAILDLPVADGLARAHERHAGDASGEDRYERMADAFHERLRDGFLDIGRRNPDRCVVVDATAGIEAVHAEIARAVGERLKVALP